MTLRFLLPLLAFVGLAILTLRRRGRILKRWQFLTLAALFLTLGRVLIPGLSLLWFALLLGLPGLFLVGGLSTQWRRLQRAARKHDLNEAGKPTSLLKQLKQPAPSIAVLLPPVDDPAIRVRQLKEAPATLRGVPLLYLVSHRGETPQPDEALERLTCLPFPLGEGSRLLAQGKELGDALNVSTLLTVPAEAVVSQAQLTALVNALVENNADVVLGQRTPTHGLTLWLHGKLLSFLAGQRIVDSHSEYRAIRTRAMNKMRFVQPRDDRAELLFEAFRLKRKVIEAPLPAVEGKKTAATLGQDLASFTSLLLSWWRVARGLW